MALPHARPGQAVDVRPLGGRLGDERTTALLKSRDLEVIRLVLKAGATLPPHKVAGEITIQCLEGRLSVRSDGATTVLGPGHLLFLNGGAVHDVSALDDASALVTIALRP